MRAQPEEATEPPRTEPAVGQIGDIPRGYEDLMSPNVPNHTVALTEKLALSVEEAGALLGISRDLAYDLVTRGELPSIRLGKRLVVPRRALEEALDRLVDAG
jgi:excisionase family DNA binding protein